MTQVAVFGDRFIRASILEQALRDHLGPVVGELAIACREFGYPCSPTQSSAEIREFAGTTSEVLETAAAAQVLVGHLPPITQAVLDGLPRLRVIGCCRTEPVNINVKAASAAGIPILYAPARNARAVAEFTVGLIIAECRNIARGHQALASGRWRSDLYLYEKAPRELHGQTIGLIGFGNIGSMMPAYLKPFGVRVLAYDPYVADEVFAARGAERVHDLADLLAQSDVVSLHARVTAETIGFLGEPQFRRMKRGAYFVNTARGPMVDYAALYRALKQGHLAGAGLETFAVEPPAPDDPLLKLENVTLTPHIAGCSRETASRAAEMVCLDIARWYAGQEPLYCCNPIVLQRAQAAPQG